MQYLTDFADQAVTLPLALGVAVWLAVAGWRRGALLWLAWFGTMEATMLGLKLVVLGCAPGPLALASPSGHTAAAVFVYGGLATLAARLRPAAASICGLGVAVVFGVTRLALHVHSVSDVVAGGVAGLTALALFAHGAGAPPVTLRPGRALLALLALTAGLHGLRLDLEPHWRAGARLLGCFLA